MFLFFLILIFYLQFPLLNFHAHERCNFVFGTQFENYCQGLYPQEVLIKYHDDWIKVGEPFVIYRSLKTPTEYAISFKKSSIHKCEVLEVISGINFTCIQNQKPGIVTLENAFGACFPMNLYVTDDLLRSCLHQNKLNEKKFKKSTKTLLHYTLDGAVMVSGGASRFTIGTYDAGGNWILIIFYIYLKLLLKNYILFV